MVYHRFHCRPYSEHSTPEHLNTLAPEFYPPSPAKMLYASWHLFIVAHHV
jgi:hypothetical protein